MSEPNDVKSIFLAAVEKRSPAERNAFLDDACANKLELRQRVEALLKVHDNPDSTLEKPAAGADPNIFARTASMPLVPESPGAVIGHFKLLQQIGEGGFGVVYLAEQEQPVRRRVALKIIKPGMDSRQVIVRFEAERQALAMMEHQNIARVLDAGTTDAGRPYFVMELVKGVPITEYCDKNKLTPRERLELFIPVCRAIQHAHQKGIIHRDIKPSNVLVCLYDGLPVPKVIDFGVAKAIEQRLTEKTMFTQHGQVMGTLEYMSPEQAELSQLDIDTRSDIYSLGVLLYELLTGTTPITKQELLTAGFIEMLRMIREKEPERPSTRLSHSHETLPTISAQRRTEPSKLSTLMRGELDWIVMKALEKDRTRRYDTANGLALDIQRYLDDEPVHACPPTTAYRVRKFIRKYRAAIAIAATFAVVLLVGAAVSTWQWREAEAARSVAVSKAEAETEARQSAETSKQAEADARAKAEADRDAKDKALQRAEGLRLTAQSSAILPTNPGLSLLLAIEGAERGPRLAAQNNALLAAMRGCREQRTLLGEDREVRQAGGVRSATFSPDGRRILTVSDYGLVNIYDTDTGKVLAALTGYPKHAKSAIFSPDGRRVATIYDGILSLHYQNRADRIYTDRVVRIWDASNLAPIAVLSGHKEQVVGAAFSPDGKRLITASLDQTARIWDVATGKEVLVVKGGHYALLSAMFSSDGQRVLTVSSNRVYGDPVHFDDRPQAEIDPLQVSPVDQFLGFENSAGNRSSSGDAGPARFARIWNASNGEEIVSMSRPPALNSSSTLILGTFSPDSQRVLTVPNGTQVLISDAATGKEIAVRKESLRFQRPVAVFSPDGLRVLTVGQSNPDPDVSDWNIANIWEVATGKQLVTLVAHEKPITSASFSADGGRVVTAAEDKTVRLWDAVTGTELAVLRGHDGIVHGAQFSPDGVRVVSASADGTARQWDANSSWEYATVLKGHARSVSSADFSPAGGRLVTASDDGTARIWNAATGKQLAALKGHASLGESPARDRILGIVRSAVFSPDGKRVLTVSVEKKTRIQRTFSKIPAIPGLAKLGGTLLTRSEEEDFPFTPVRLWDAETGHELIALKAQKLQVHSACFSPDGHRVLTAEDNRIEEATVGLGGTLIGGVSSSESGAQTSARIYDALTGQELVTLNDHLGSIITAAFGPDGRRVLTVKDSGSVDPSIRIWDVEDGKKLMTLGEPGSGVEAYWSPDGQHVLTLQKNGTGWTRLWQAASGKEIFRIRGENYFAPVRSSEGFARSNLFSPFSCDGKRFVLPAGADSVAIWDATTGKQTATLKGHRGVIHSAVFSPDMTKVVTASSDETARIWESATGRELFTLTGHQGAVLFATFSPDGQEVVTTSEDGTARIWAVDPLKVAISRKPRDLTDRERETFEVGP